MFAGKLAGVGDIGATLKTVGAKLGDTVQEKTRSLQSHLEETFEVRGEKSEAQIELEKWQAEMSIGNLRCV